MAAQDVIEQLLALPDVTAQRRFLKEHVTVLDDRVADALKGQSDRAFRADVHYALQTVDLLFYLAELTGNPLHRALGLLAEANVRCLGGLGEYQRAIELYDEAAVIYEMNHCPAEQAQSQVGKVYALAFLGRYDEALEIGRWVSVVLEEHARWRPLANLIVNLAMMQGRMGRDEESLSLFDRARELYQKLGLEEPYLPMVDQNRAIPLRNLGQFEAAIQASQYAQEMLARFGQSAEAARAQQNLAITYFILGRYNEALELLGQARDAFVADGRQRDAILAELFVSDCLLQLRRFADVLDKCQRVRNLFTELGTRFEVALALLNEAVAYAGLNDYDKAVASLAEAHCLFAREDNQVWMACANLEMAALVLRQGCFEEALTTAQACAQVFDAHSLPIRQAQAHLVAARAAAALHQHDLAAQLIARVLAVAESRDVPSLIYQGRHLLGALAVARQDLPEALAEYERAVRELERLRGRLMVEFRADFLEDKQVVYEDMVLLCLDAARPLQALEYAERAKSRALLDLLAYRLDLSLQARSVADRPLVEELTRLRAERDRLYRRWEGREDSQEEDWTTADESRQQVRREVLALEKRITELWHGLLIRNADYARDAALWQVRTEPIQPYLPPETVLLEYFVAQGQLIAFVVTSDAIQVRCLPEALAQVQRLLRLFWLNLKAVPKSTLKQLANLTANALGLLQRLHELLIVPLNDVVAFYPRLVIVPHGALHYLPFHALHDGCSFVLERHEISYLPGGSFLRYCQGAQPEASGLLALGHSRGGRLPYTVQEARSIAELLNNRPFLEDEATLARLQETVGDCRIIHLATHGEFRPDNPLFSGLALADGWLTTLDIFDLRLKASLVTLSACQTGRSVIGGGDELLGLLRAFLCAGAASVLLSLWTVEDCCAAQLMPAFYRKLLQGWTKSAALRYAQRQIGVELSTDGGASAARYAHPYFWAPFFLVGDAGAL